MDMNDYKNVMNRIHADDALKERIFDKCRPVEAKPKRKRLGPIFAVAAAAIIGTMGVSAAIHYDWLESIFNKNEPASENIGGLQAQTSKYSCVSNCGIELALVNAVITEKDIYCEFKVTKNERNIPIEKLSLVDVMTDSMPDTFGAVSSCFINDKGNIVAYLNCTRDYFSESGNLRIYFNNNENFADDSSDRPITASYASYADDLSDEEKEYITPDLITKEDLTKENLDDYDFDFILVDLDYETQLIPPLEIKKDEIISETTYDPASLFTKITVTPMQLTAQSSGSSFIEEPIRLKLKNGAEVTSGDVSDMVDSRVTADSSAEYAHIWVFEQPVDPSEVSEIYLGNELIFSNN